MFTHVGENKKIFKAIHRSAHAQRNYDLDRDMPQEDLDLIVEAATQCPSKQNISFYKAHFITNRDLIEKIHAETEGFYARNGVWSDKSESKGNVTNSQVLGNLLIVFEANNPFVNGRMADSPTKRALQRKMELVSGAVRPVHDESKVEWTVERDQHMAVGVAAGYVNMTASMMGYGTGCCACFRVEEVKELLGIDGEPLLMMGIGFKQKGVNRRVHHTERNFKFPTFIKQKINTFFWK